MTGQVAEVEHVGADLVEGCRSGGRSTSTDLVAHSGSSTGRSGPGERRRSRSPCRACTPPAWRPGRAGCSSCLRCPRPRTFRRRPSPWPLQPPGRQIAHRPRGAVGGRGVMARQRRGNEALKGDRDLRKALSFVRWQKDRTVACAAAAHPATRDAIVATVNRHIRVDSLRGSSKCAAAYIGCRTMARSSVTAPHSPSSTRILHSTVW